MAKLSGSEREKIEAPNLAFVATVMEDGSPHVSPVWIAMEDEKITFNTVVGNLKDRNMRRDPRVAISTVNRDDIYDSVTIRGRVVEMTDGEVAERQIDDLARKYLGKIYPWRRPGEARLKVVVEPQVVAR
jgi:PPOX class probable F420-dependent enzyme